METQKETQFFANIYNKVGFDDFTKEVKYSFLIENNIYQTEPKLWRDSKYFTYLLESARKEKKELFYLVYRYSNDLLREIYDTFKNAYNHTDVFSLTESIKIKTSILFDRKSKIKYLKKEHQKYSKRLNKIPTFFWYNLEEKDLKEYLYRDFEEYVMDEISEEFVYQYLSSEYPDFHKENIFFELIRIESNLEVLRCIEELIKSIVELEEVDKREMKIGVQLTLTQQIFLLDEIRNIEADVWDVIPKTKKAQLLSSLFGKSSENIRKSLSVLEVSSNKFSERQVEDYTYVKTLLKKTLG